MDLGAARRGVDMGPGAIRYADLTEKLQALGHDVDNLDSILVAEPETREPGDPRLKYLAQIVPAIKALADRVEERLAAGSLPIVLGGDPRIALGSISGAAPAPGHS